MKQLRLIIMIVLALCVAAVAFGVVWYVAGLRPVDKKNKTAQLYRLESGVSSQQVGRDLQAAGLVRDHNAFFVYLLLHGLRAKLQAGTYALAPAKSAAEIAAIISHGSIATDHLVVPEGSTVADIIKSAQAKGLAKADLASAAAASYDYDFLAQRPAGATNLEGFLFPDSYTITPGTSANAVFRQLLDNFSRQITPTLVAEFKAQGLTLYQGVTLASMVEKEVATPEDRAIVAQVFLSRLRAGQALGSDVTVNYGAALLGTGFSTQLDSPYNTYRYKGLPIGPICNPGLASLQAVANPAQTDYLYFLAGKDGKTHFAKDFATHQQNITKFLN